MGVLALSIGLWCLVMYSLRVAFFGNPLYQTVVESEQGLLRRAEQMLAERRAPASDAEAAFMRRFSRLTLLEFGAFLAEVGLLAFFLWRRTVVWVCAVLLAKNLVVIILGIFMARRHAAHGVFRSLLKLPPWYIWVDRAAALVSGIGLLVTLLVVNRVLPW